MCGIADRQDIRKPLYQQPQLTDEDFCIENFLILGESPSLHHYAKSSQTSTGRNIRCSGNRRHCLHNFSAYFCSGETLLSEAKEKNSSQSVSLLLD